MEAGSEMALKAGNVFNLRAGTGTSAIGLSNNETNGYMQWAGNADPASAPYSVKQDGSVKMTKLTLGNSAITDLTQMYAQTFADNADSTHAAVIKMYVPSEATGVQSLKLSFELEKYRAFSTTTASTNSVERTSTAGGAGTVTSTQSDLYTNGTYGSTTISGDGISSGEATGNTGSAGALLTTGTADAPSGPWGPSTETTTSISDSTTGTKSNYSSQATLAVEGVQHTHIIPSHSHSMDHTHDISIPQHQHTVAGHQHTGAAHYHSLNSHIHTIVHTHALPDHSHGYQHTHDVTISGHTHKVTIDGHNHAITYGIYEGNTATSCTVAVDGNTVGSFAFMNAQNITDYLIKADGKITRDAWHTVTITPNGLTRIIAHAFMIMVVGSATDAIY
jgi:hypothetical protein